MSGVALEAGAKFLGASSVVFFASHAHGGIRELWTNLADGFQERGYRSELVGLYPLIGSMESEDSVLRWEYLLPERPKGLLGHIRLAWTLSRWLRRAKPDVIISSMPAANVLIAIFGRLFSPSTHIILSHHSPSFAYRAGLNLMDRFAGTLSNVKTIVSVSDAVASTFQNRPDAYKRKSVTIHNAIPPKIEQQMQALRRVGGPIGRVIVVSGRLESQKNHPMLIRAAAYMRDVRVDILGGGPDEAELRALMASIGVLDRFRLLGSRHRQEAMAIIAQGDVFVQVSLFEGHSLALIEATHLGLPLIVSNVPSQVEAVTAEDGTVCGLLVDLDDYEGLAAAVHQVLDDPAEYARLSSLALRLAAETTFDTMVRHYNRLIQSNGSGEAVPLSSQSAGSVA